MSRIIIGLTGAFGSGTSFIAQNFFDDTDYKKYSLSTILKEMYKEQIGNDFENRSQLQEFGNSLRENNKAILAEILDERYISKERENNIIIESIRNPAEIRFFREKYSEFILIGVFADYDIRWKRVKGSYKGSKDAFDIDEQKDKGTLEPEYGQKISDCFFESDLILSNNEEISCKGKNEAYKNMRDKINAYLLALQDPAKSNPTLQETLMAAAYISGRRSKCIKRKVGAVIADKYDRIISSGFNGVPFGLKECKTSLGECYRDQKRAILGSKIAAELTSVNENATTIVRKNIKLLELCRALHGEESAILNLVGRSIDLSDITMYVTTYPCNLCANKIVQTGIKKVVYFEPYPVEEAKKIFMDAGTITEPFEGVTFRAFFRFYQFEP